ncbi:MAG: SH3 domain-containing protein [Lachnospiraceae bacterium]|nr:SH3 domain-containing protein [Lachnospiraceae bacterium]
MLKLKKRFEKIIVFGGALVLLSGCSLFPEDASVLPASETSTGNEYADSLARKIDDYVDEEKPAEYDPEAATSTGNVTTILADGTVITDTQEPVTDENGEAVDVSGGSDATEPTTEPEVADFDGKFEKKDDLVEATGNVTVRAKPSTSSDPVMLLRKGETIHRIGYSEDWTKVQHENNHFYIASKYLKPAD